jgi:ankyrin repeat protein
LADYDADVNKLMPGGYGPLHIALHSRRTEIARCLIAAGADHTLLSNSGHSPLDFAHSVSYRKQIEKIISDLWHDLPIHKACHNNHLEALRKLVQQKNIENKINAVAAAPGRGSWSALHVASFMNRLEAAELLVRSGADLRLATTDNGGLTALHLASSRGHSEMLVLLMRGMVAQSEQEAAAAGESSGGGAAIERKSKKARA